MLALGLSGLAQPTGPATRRADANGNPIRVATKTGHVSNYDEAKVRPYTLPDPLVMASGEAVRDARAWVERRRPEVLRLYETEVFGRVPADAPQVAWEAIDSDVPAMFGTAGVAKRLVGRVGDRPDGLRINVSLTLPARAAGPVPVILCLNFFGANGTGRGGATTNPARGRAGATTRPATAPAFRGGDPVADILARGWGYATVGYADIQPDRANSFTSGVIGLTLAPGQAAPAPDEWGTISAWAWGVSRIIDYLETDRAVDAKRVAVMGHSRLGKTVLWAAARDPRVAAVFSSCSGEMGAALSRRDWGETVDDMAQNFPWQFCGNFQKYAGHWDQMPVDAHLLIALCAPRPVFISGGTGDQWADPKGEFLAAVAAGPVYRLLGAKDLGTTELPPLDTPLIDGDLGFVYHTGGHVATPADWRAFLEFAGRHFEPHGRAAGGEVQ